MKEVFVVDEMNMVVSGSWDRTLRRLPALWKAARAATADCIGLGKVLAGGLRTWVLEIWKGFWNLQQPTPVATLQLPERRLARTIPVAHMEGWRRLFVWLLSIQGVYTMDVKYPLLVVGCAERHVPLCCKPCILAHRLAASGHLRSCCN